MGDRQILTLYRDRPLVLESGDSLSPVDVAWESWGPAHPEGTILVLHALTGDAHAASHHPGDRPGWWEPMVGPGKPFDTRRWQVICMNVLGGVAGSTGPASLAPDGRPYGERFPVVTVGDMVTVQAQALDALGIGRLHLVTGGSLGGMQALEWAWRFPERVDRVAAVAAQDRLSAMGIGLNAAQREAVRLGLASDRPHDGLKVARMVAMLSYRSAAHYDARFARELQPGVSFEAPLDPRFQIESYLLYQGTKLAGRFDAWSYVVLSRAMDLFDLWRGREEQATPAAIHLASISDDWLFPPAEVSRLAARLRRLGMTVTCRTIQSDLGHDAFLTDLPPLKRWLGRVAESYAAPRSDSWSWPAQRTGDS
jgi:homoserine O-acetyltransferase